MATGSFVASVDESVYIIVNVSKGTLRRWLCDESVNGEDCGNEDTVRQYEEAYSVIQFLSMFENSCVRIVSSSEASRPKSFWIWRRCSMIKK